MCSILQKHLISMACIFLCCSPARVRDLQAYRKTDVTRECISCIMEMTEMLLSFQTGLNLVTVAVTCVILENISSLEPLSVSTEPRYLKLEAAYINYSTPVNSKENISHDAAPTKHHLAQLTAETTQKLPSCDNLTYLYEGKAFLAFPLIRITAVQAGDTCQVVIIWPTCTKERRFWRSLSLGSLGYRLEHCLA